MSRRKAPVGLVLCAMALLLFGLWLLGVAIVFLVAPESLRDAGFGQNVTLGNRVAGLLFFAGVAALLAWVAWGLIRLRPSAFENARVLAFGMAVVCVIQIVRDDADSVLYWLTLVPAVAIGGYLSLPSVRALLRP